VSGARMLCSALCAAPNGARALGTRGPQFPFRVAGPVLRLHPGVVPPFGQSGCGSVPPRTDPAHRWPWECPTSPSPYIS
jgi:hypothetical protein